MVLEVLAPPFFGVSSTLIVSPSDFGAWPRPGIISPIVLSVLARGPLFHDGSLPFDT